MSQLPDSWYIVPFSSLVTYTVGKTPPRADVSFWDNSATSVPWVSIADMQPYEQVNHTKECISEKAFHRIFRGRAIPEGTLLMSFKLSIGRVAFLGQDACHNEAIISIQPNKGVNVKYLAYFLSFFDYSELYDRQIKGNTLNKEKIDRIPVKCPPKEEQDAIAATLDTIRDSICIANKKYKLLFALKHATMHKLFTCGLRGEPQKETEIGLVPESWEVVPLDEVAFVQTGVAKGRKIISEELIEIPYLRVANVQDGRLDLSEIKTIRIRSIELDRYLLQEGDVLLTEGGDFDKLGRGFIWRGEIAGCIHQNHVFAVRVDRDKLLPEFFAYLAQSPYGKAYFLKVAHKTTNLACINTTKLKAFPITFPDPAEQQEIVDILDAIDQKIDLHRRKKAVLEELFKSLLHKLMTGEIRVDELNLAALSPQDNKEPGHVQ